MIDDTTVNESKAADDGENEFNEPDILEQNIIADLAAQPDDEELLMEEAVSKVLEATVKPEDGAEEEGEEEEEEGIGGETKSLFWFFSVLIAVFDF